MKKKLLISFSTSVFCLLYMIIIVAVATADNTTDSSHEIAQKLRQNLNGLTSLSFHFTQRTMGQMSGRPRQASGKAFFVKKINDSKMRWNYSAPDMQVIISDGTTLTMYFEKLNQMIITSAETLQQDVTFSFFAGGGDIERDFIIMPGHDNSNEQKSDYGFEVIKLIPKSPTSQIQAIRLWITTASQIQRIEILDNFDTITLLNLSNIEENNLVKDGALINTEMFNFSPPEGTEIIHQ